MQTYKHICKQTDILREKLVIAPSERKISDVFVSFLINNICTEIVTA